MERGLSCNGFELAEALGAAWHGAGAEEAGAIELLSAFLRISIDRKQGPSALFKPGLDRNFARIEIDQRDFLRELLFGTSGFFLPLSELQVGNIRPVLQPGSLPILISMKSPFSLLSWGTLSPPLSHFWSPETVYNCNNHSESGRLSEK